MQQKNHTFEAGGVRKHLTYFSDIMKPIVQNKIKVISNTSTGYIYKSHDQTLMTLKIN